MKYGTKCLALCLALLSLLMLAGCSTAAKTENASADMVTSGTASDGGIYTEKVETTTEEAGLLSGNTIGVLDAEKIIYSAYAEVETLDFEGSLDEVERMVQQYGAFVQSSSITGSDYYAESRGYRVNRRAEYVLRVPKEAFSQLMDALPTLGNVPYSHVDTENVTTQYVDTEARLESCRIQQARLLELLEQAETVEDMLTIEGYLADVRYQIESLTSQLQNWDALIDYSTVTLSISEVQDYTQEPETQLTYWQKLGTGLKRTLKGIGTFFQELFRVLVVYLPVLVLLAVVVLIVVLILRRCRKRKRQQRQTGGGEQPEQRDQ